LILKPDFLYRTGIESVVEKENKEKSSAGNDLPCTACQMLVIWVQNQLREKATKETAINYLDKVGLYQNPASFSEAQICVLSFGF
jgi:phytepsin